MRVRNKYIVLIIIILGGFGLSWRMEKSFPYLPSPIIIDRNCIKFDTAVFSKDDGKWFVRIESSWYNVNNHNNVLDDVLLTNSKTDSMDTYVFKPKFFTKKFGHIFNSISATVLSGNPDYDDYEYFNSGIYIHAGLKLSSSFKSSLGKIFTKASSGLLNEYVSDDRVYFSSPLLYIPFPLSNKGYMFSGEVLEDFDELTTYYQNQNFYSTLAYIPTDIRKLGEVVKYDENGVLLDLKRKKTSDLNIRLQRLSDESKYYAATVKYNEVHKDELINKDDYKEILDYSQQCDVYYEMYDRRIFYNMRQMLSNMGNEKNDLAQMLDNKCRGWCFLIPDDIDIPLYESADCDEIKDYIINDTVIDNPLIKVKYFENGVANVLVRQFSGTKYTDGWLEAKNLGIYLMPERDTVFLYKSSDYLSEVSVVDVDSLARKYYYVTDASDGWLMVEDPENSDISGWIPPECQSYNRDAPLLRWVGGALVPEYEVHAPTTHGSAAGPA